MCVLSQVCRSVNNIAALIYGESERLDEGPHTILASKKLSGVEQRCSSRLYVFVQIASE